MTQEPLPPSLTPLPPKTTSEEDIATHGQRRINLIWETTQAVVSIIVTVGVVGVAGVLVLRGDQTNGQAAFLLLGNAFFVVISTYLTRTNHTKVGGVDANPRPQQPTERRGE